MSPNTSENQQGESDKADMEPRKSLTERQLEEEGRNIPPHMLPIYWMRGGRYDPRMDYG